MVKCGHVTKPCEIHVCVYRAPYEMRSRGPTRLHELSLLLFILSWKKLFNILKASVMAARGCGEQSRLCVT
ncbi:hypothetical protein XENTR_v10003609 [Xenopus tropicalis]|nr:hypothetical protein XENTR_v10003609 [Xenopus tropicalis]